MCIRDRYKEVLVKMGDKPVIIRTMDIGGDKNVPYIDIPKEMNPFLGYRAIRLCLGNLEVFRTQLRAILRASVYGNVKIMIPMISTMKELKDSKKILLSLIHILLIMKKHYTSKIMKYA